MVYPRENKTIEFTLTAKYRVIPLTEGGYVVQVVIGETHSFHTVAPETVKFIQGLYVTMQAYNLHDDIPLRIESIDDSGMVTLNRPLRPGESIPSLDLEGDMIPKWYDGRWWVSHSDYVKHREEKGETD
jgi:hypothetical protein